MKTRVLIAVTHLLGSGHLTRAAALGRALARRGHAVTLASGGVPTRLVPSDGLTLLQLPPVRVAGTDFRTLLDESGQPATPGRLADRRDRLVRAVRALAPEIVVTELYPFGRRVLAEEFAALVAAARTLEPRPLIACSVRDVLVAPARAERIAAIHDRLAGDYDLILVHGDPDLVPLEASWPVDARIRSLLRYTGYVDDGAAVDRSGSRVGVVVSAGSSDAGLPLLKTALEAAAFVPEQPWRVLVGPAIPPATVRDWARRVRGAARSHVTVQAARPDFRQLLAAAAVSVSQSGYNTVVDLLRAEPQAILVPFEAGHETEQRLRAERLEAAGLATVLPEADLSAPALAGAVARALEQPRVPGPLPRLDGAECSADLLLAALSSPAVRTSAPDWRPLRDAFARARDRGLAPAFWWRDDDAAADTLALRRLFALAREWRVPLALAAVPRRLDGSLRPLLEESGVRVLVHGLCHANHAPPGAKKAEFGAHRPLSVLAAEAAGALAEAQTALAAAVLPVLVPPWNRVAGELLACLPALGYTGVSAFGDRPWPARSDLAQVNAHLDPINWHGSRGLAAPEHLIAGLAGALHRRIEGTADRDEPIGILTHHLVHDEAVWRFCAALLEEMARISARFVLAEDLFCVRQPDRPATLTR